MQLHTAIQRTAVQAYFFIKLKGTASATAFTLLPASAILLPKRWLEDLFRTR